MDFYHDTWMGYLTEQIIRQVVAMGTLKCPGCQDKLKSPLLHLCHQQSLLDKMKYYFEEVRGPMLSCIVEYYEQVCELLPHSDDLEYDRDIYCLTGRTWLTIASCEAVYYGRFVSTLNDAYIEKAFVNVKKAKKMSKHPKGT